MSDDDLDLLMRAVRIEADLAALDARGRGATPSKVTYAAVETAFKFAVHNNLITVNDPDDWPLFFERLPG